MSKLKPTKCPVIELASRQSDNLRHTDGLASDNLRHLSSHQSDNLRHLSSHQSDNLRHQQKPLCDNLRHLGGLVKDNAEPKFFNEASRSAWLALKPPNPKLVLLVEGPFKLPSVAVLSFAAYLVVERRARMKRAYMPAPIEIDEATAFLLSPKVWTEAETRQFLAFND